MSWALYVILDRDAAGGRDLAALAQAAIRGGADALQLRDKRATDAQLADQARRILEEARPAGVPLIVNDRAAAAKAADADGVHLGQDDLPLAQARALLGADKLIGKSTHSLDQALAAIAEGADYIGFGPLYATPTKPAYPAIGPAAIGAVMQRVRQPVVCIGGIMPQTLPQALQAGARCVAVVRAVCAADDPEAATRALKQAVTQFHRPVPASRL